MASLLRRTLLLSPLAAALGTAAAEPRLLRVCANAALGPPEGDATPYLMMRRVQELLPQLRFQFSPLPWARCLQEAGQGRFDAVLSASHTHERALHLRYPLSPQGEPDEHKRLFQIGYALLRRKGTAVQWDGQTFSGTGPRAGESLGAERGYSVVQFARERGAHVEERNNITALLDSLRLQRVQGALLNQEHAAQLLSEAQWARNFELGGPALATRPYFLPFNATLAEREPALAQTVWDAIEKVRRSPAFAQEFSLGLSSGQRRDLKP
ncbi:substrate-binding periplasmic protein [Inhella sp.]|uniref:substrate-binding periplasmic protein n=1 Tax=Inhella sp. TaxID=1921806 RepID=UPI0035B4E058